jgi:hypothetical protein
MTITLPTLSGFLSTYPEFNQPKYTDHALQIWFDVALSLVSQKRWGNIYQTGIYLATAHFLALNVTDTRSSVNGLLTNNNVDGVNYTKDVSSVVNADPTQFNQTKYGVLYYQLALIRGSGPRTVAGPPFPVPTPNNPYIYP